MQITARKQRFNPVNIKYAAAALAIAGALAAGVTTYTVTRDDSQASQPVAAAPTLKSHYVEQAGEGALSGNAAVTTDQEVLRPTMREGFQATGPGDDLTGSSMKARGVPSVTSREDVTAYTPFGAGEGFIDGSDGAGLSYLAPEVRSYAEMLLLEQNGVFDLTPAESASAGVLDEEFTQQNPGADTATQMTRRYSAPANGGLVP